MATRLFLVVVLRRETPFFGDETLSRRRFEARNSFFLATRPFLVVVFGPETSFFGDETLSRRRFEARNSLFWRRDPFSSSFLGRKLHFLATRPFLVVTFGQETPFFGDETCSRRHFWAGYFIF
ncbi:hypothetical protein [Caldibacillus thermoamylovorans]|uniref:hypothetical protein n=1 Tax=Caldibacillus thermoamylovorans TaxID=35841 RepID=UPI000A923786|nr:hypothetical protein [Caldibacillus thermoamylovorans]